MYTCTSKRFDHVRQRVKFCTYQKYSSFVDTDIFHLCRKHHNKGERRLSRIGFVIEIMHFREFVNKAQVFCLRTFYRENKETIEESMDIQ